MSDALEARTTPIGLRHRALAPDLARGAMLLLIALANVHVYTFGHQLGARGYPLAQDAASQVVTLVQMLLVDGRAYPMFGFLFGYGIVQLARRNGDPLAARRLVRRRGWWMIAIGATHALLLFAGDIVAAYGLLAVLLASQLIGGRDRTLLRITWAGLLLVLPVGVASSMPPPPGYHAVLPSMAIPNPVSAALARIPEFLGIGFVINAVMVFGSVALGAWAARRRLLDEPEAHRPLLARLALGGLSLAALGGLPLALVSASYWTDPGLPAILAFGSLHALTGYAGGLGYVALFGLVAAWIQRRRGPGPLTRALVACGQRSLTCYLAQSVVFVALLPAFGGGLGDQLTVAQLALVAFGTWFLILLAAEGMRLRGLRGPAEVLLRRLTYRSAASTN